MRRRDLIVLLGGSAAAWPLAVRAQQTATPVIGFLSSASASLYAGPLHAFHEGLRETGYAEGRNVVIEYRWAEGNYNRLPALAADLVQRQVTVIATTSTPAALVAKAATTAIPIVFTTGGDPVGLGLVTSLSRPNGNVTGASQLNAEVGPKRLELMHELFPTVTIVVLLINPTSPVVAETISKDMQAAARTLGLQLHVLQAKNEHEIDEAFAKSVQLGAGALVFGGDAFFNSRSEQLGALTLRYGIPTIYQYREFTTAGGLISYGGSVVEVYRQAGVYTGRILGGEKPANLPVVLATKIELVINLKTAKTLGITIPQSILSRADEVIE
jgi:putative tryptophan/tyrosine transport system substrate-binding protein